MRLVIFGGHSLLHLASAGVLSFVAAASDGTDDRLRIVGTDGEIDFRRGDCCLASVDIADCGNQKEMPLP